MADVLEFAPLDFPGCQGQSRMFAFQSLHPGQFIAAQRLFSLLC